MQWEGKRETNWVEVKESERQKEREKKDEEKASMQS